VDIQKYTRLRALIHNINRQRKLQTRKIDILCTDMVQAHRGILERLEDLSFTSRIHESLIGCVDTAAVLKSVSAMIASRFGNCCGVAFLLLDGDGPLICHSEDASAAQEVTHFPAYFTVENVRAVCAGNRSQLLQELLELPLQLPPKTIDQIWAAAVPLSVGHSQLGILLLYGSAESQMPAKLIRAACTIAPAIAKATAACKNVPAHS
jgi:hypothetical protein